MCACELSWHNASCGQVRHAVAAWLKPTHSTTHPVFVFVLSRLRYAVWHVPPVTHQQSFQRCMPQVSAGVEQHLFTSSCAGRAWSGWFIELHTHLPNSCKRQAVPFQPCIPAGGLNFLHQDHTCDTPAAISQECDKNRTQKHLGRCRAEPCKTSTDWASGLHKEVDHKQSV